MKSVHNDGFGDCVQAMDALSFPLNSRGWPCYGVCTPMTSAFMNHPWPQRDDQRGADGVVHFILDASLIVSPSITNLP